MALLYHDFTLLIAVSERQNVGEIGLRGMNFHCYSTHYTMLPQSYKDSEAEKRWIGIGKGGSISKDGVYFVVFFKEITDSSVVIYKHECANGKEEAEAFAYPAHDATADHG